MSRARPSLDLFPERCDRCGRCERACGEHAIKAGSAYLYVDWERCDGCGACVEACDRDAIRPKAGAPGAPRQARPEAVIAQAAPVSGPRPAAPVPKLDPVRDASGVRVEWSLAEAAAVLAAMLALFVAEEVVLGSTWMAGLKPGAAAVGRLVVLGAYYAAQLAVVAFLVRRRGGRLLTAFGLAGAGTRLGHKAASAAVSVIALVAALVAMYAWGQAADAAGWVPPARWNSDITALFGGDAAGLLLTLSMAAVLGPFVEELVFRGVVLDALSRRWGSLAAILASAGVFGVFHFSLWQFVPAAILGLVLAWLTERRGSLWPAVAVHCAYNGVAVLAAFWLQSVGGA